MAGAGQWAAGEGAAVGKTSQVVVNPMGSMSEVRGKVMVKK